MDICVGLGLAAMALLGASRWVHEHQWGVLVAGLLGGAGTIGGLMSQFPLVRFVAGFAVSTRQRRPPPDARMVVKFKKLCPLKRSGG